MPAVVRQSRTGLPKARKEMSFTWSHKTVKELLKLIKDSPESRLAFFPSGIIKRYTKSGQARGLLLELVKNEPDYLEWLRLEGWIKKDEQGQWVPRTAWISTSFSNPVITQMASLNTKYTKLRTEYKIKQNWTRFADLPHHIKADFKSNYPWYFQFKELADPSQEFDRPPVLTSQDRLNRVRETATPAPAHAAARAVPESQPQLPPSPSPSEISSSSPSASPSPPLAPELDPSPSPSPSPPPVVSLFRLPLAPKPGASAHQSSSISLPSTGPRPHIRPSAIASSSPVPVNVESPSSSSSASPASDVHIWGDSESESDANFESEHEMENDTVTIRGSVVPSRQPTPAGHVALHKRAFEAACTPSSKRRKSDREPVIPKRELEESFDAFDNNHLNQELGAPQDFMTVETSRRATLSPSTGETHRDVTDSSNAGYEADDIELDNPATEDTKLRRHSQTKNERRDLLMAQLRETVASDTMGCPDSIPKTSYHNRSCLRKARTDQAKLKAFQKHRTVVFRNIIFRLNKYGLLPQCLKNCRLRFDSVEDHPRLSQWSRTAQVAGATLCRNTKMLFMGDRHEVRVHVRVDLSGLEVEPDAFLGNKTGEDSRVIKVHQYSFLAFGRFYYNRICSAIEGNYEPLPPLVVHEAEIDDTEDVETTSATRARLLDQLSACVTPCQTLSVIPEFFTRPSKTLPRYKRIPHQSPKAAASALLALQIRIALLTLHAMNKAGMLTGCLAGWRVQADYPAHRKAFSNLRKQVKSAGGVICTKGQLMEGSPDEKRCQVHNELRSYAIGPETVVDAVRIRHYGFLAFLRLFYQRILDSENGHGTTA